MLEPMRSGDFDQVFAIMERSFPPDEYRPYEEQKALLKETEYSIYVLPDAKSERIRAFIAIWKMADFSFLEHFAVDTAYRSEGIGSGLLREAGQLLSGPICLEVEPPETALAKRRIAFYERNGFFLNQYPYAQPPISKGRKPLLLFIMTSEEGITAQRFAKIREDIYRTVYKESWRDGKYFRQVNTNNRTASPVDR